MTSPPTSRASVAQAAEAETYRQMHDIARELGYPSILEALEHLSELKAPLEPQPPMGLADMNEMDAKHPGWDIPQPAEVRERIARATLIERGVITAASEETDTITVRAAIKAMSSILGSAFAGGGEVYGDSRTPQTEAAQPRDAQDAAAAYVDAQDCRVRNPEGDFDGYSGQQMVECFMAGAALAPAQPRGDDAALIEQLERAALDYDQDLIAGNLFQAAHATIVSQATRLEALSRLSPPQPSEAVTVGTVMSANALADLRDAALEEAARELEDRARKYRLTANDANYDNVRAQECLDSAARLRSRKSTGKGAGDAG